jgi:hypothetical protein
MKEIVEYVAETIEAKASFSAPGVMGLLQDKHGRRTKAHDR